MKVWKHKKFDLPQVIMISVVVAMFTFMFHGDVRVLVDYFSVNVWMPYSTFIMIGMFLVLIVPFASIMIKLQLEEREYNKMEDESDYGIYKSAHLMFKREEK